MTTFYNDNGKGTYRIEVSTDTTKCPGTATTLSNAWLNVVDPSDGGCCDCWNDFTCNILNAQSSGCCWGDGDWDMWVTLDPDGTISDTQVDILIQLNSDPYGGSPGDTVYIFSGALTCADGSFSATDEAFCASIDGIIDPTDGSSGTLRILDDPCDSVQTEICTSDWDDNATGFEACGLYTSCFLCEPLSGSLSSSSEPLSGPVPSSPDPSGDAPASPQLRESPVLQRLRMQR